VTQPAFGRRIRALEHWLGVMLIDRSVHPLELTPAGRMFRDNAVSLMLMVVSGALALLSVFVQRDRGGR
jgi:DNA-binding transcriptional LysR family regulator